MSGLVNTYFPCAINFRKHACIRSTSTWKNIIPLVKRRKIKWLIFAIPGCKDESASNKVKGSKKKKNSTFIKSMSFRTLSMF